MSASASEFESNLERQSEELEVLKSIYEEAIDASNYKGAASMDDLSSAITLRIAPSEAAEIDPIVLEVVFPGSYPADASPLILSIYASWMTPEEESDLERILVGIAEGALGQVVVYEWVEAVREQADALAPLAKTRGARTVDVEQIATSTQSEAKSIVMLQKDVVQSKPVRASRSKFIAYAARVHSLKEVEALKNLLLQDAKIAKATHNMIAYRFQQPGCPLHEGRDDDGEHGGGEQILKIIQKLNARNVAVVVSRWYGGIHLSSERFRIIARVTQAVICENGWEDRLKTPRTAVDSAETSTSSSNKETVVPSTVSSSDGLQSKRKLRPSRDVYARIRWDPSLDTADFVIGYIDRFTGVQYVPYDDFTAEDVYEYEGIPFHRIVSFDHFGKRIWDRETRIDLLFPDSGEPSGQ